jgi:Family of unknown function (DUF6148)
MNIFTLLEIEELITTYKAALIAVAKGQEFWLDGERLTRASIPDIKSALEMFRKEKVRLTGRRKSVTVVGRIAR